MNFMSKIGMGISLCFYLGFFLLCFKSFGFEKQAYFYL